MRKRIHKISEVELRGFQGSFSIASHYPQELRYQAGILLDGKFYARFAVTSADGQLRHTKSLKQAVRWYNEEAGDA